MPLPHFSLVKELESRLNRTYRSASSVLVQKVVYSNWAMDVPKSAKVDCSISDRDKHLRLALYRSALFFSMPMMFLAAASCFHIYMPLDNLGLPQWHSHLSPIPKRPNLLSKVNHLVTRDANRLCESVCELCVFMCRCSHAQSSIQYNHQAVFSLHCVYST